MRDPTIVWNLLVLSILLLTVGAETEVDQTPASYWHKMFPNTTMPKYFQQLLPNGEKPEILAGRVWSTTGEGRMRSYRNLWLEIKPQEESLLTYGRRNSPSNVSPIFFLENDLKPGSKMNLNINNSQIGNHIHGNRRPTFLSPKEAQAIPFSISRYDDILRIFSIQPHSLEADVVKQALHDCAMHSISGETKYCATSLESMIKFAISQLGTRDIQVLKTSAFDREDNVGEQIYRVDSRGVKIKSLQVVTCHSMLYPHAVFYCHKLRNTKLYMVPLVGAADGGFGKNAIAVCHSDTSSWNPRHLSFQVLGIKPGTLPVCHFLSSESVAWVRS